MENKPIYEYEIDGEGTKRWYLNDIPHREDGPAVEYANGEKIWKVNGITHRLDGPAHITSDGDKVWYINDCHVTDQIIQWAEENDIDLDNLTDVDKALIKLVWSDYGK